MKGIILAGGKGTRLSPLTNTISKQLLPVYNKPMIYYPLGTLTSMGIEDILIITADHIQCRLFQEQLKDCKLNITYMVQGEPRGLADAFIIGESFIGSSDVCMILGDNVFIQSSPIVAEPNTIFTYKVKNPSAYGVADVQEGQIKNIVEKPDTYISNDAVVGLYMFYNSCVEYAKQLKPSKRGELEIVDLIKKIMENEIISVHNLDGFWFDCGNHDDLLDCANLVRAIEHRTNTIVGYVCEKK
jgi:glucose-1-phosphate thymidylyltransferase